MKKIIAFVLCLVFCLMLTACGETGNTDNTEQSKVTETGEVTESAVSEKLTEADIKKALEVDNDERIFTVKSVAFATDSITLGDNVVKVEGGTITAGDSEFKTETETYKQITGYYFQSAGTYFVYVLSENSEGKTSVWKLTSEGIDSSEFSEPVKTDVENATDLFLINCEEIVKALGQTPTVYQVYAVSNNKPVLLD